jgi:hypothetical protein
MGGGALSLWAGEGKNQTAIKGEKRSLYQVTIYRHLNFIQNKRKGKRDSKKKRQKRKEAEAFPVVD